MATESETFQQSDLGGFLDELILVDRDALLQRLAAADARLAELAGRIPEDAAPVQGGWSAKQVVAHVAALSKLYGMLTYRVGSGAMADFQLLPMVHQRDAAGAQLAQVPVADLVAMVLADHARTAEYVRQASAGDLRRTCRFDFGPELTAGEILRFTLVAHVEQHVAQLEEALG